MMEFEAVNHMFPEWHVWESFAASEGLSALRRDATAGVQSVRTGVRHPDEINTLFDPSIVYAKGSRLLYMLKTYIGETAFRSGLTAYFRKHAYRNTTGADLWEALSAASREDIGAFMNPWLEQAGFPVVSLKREDRTATITQQHFQENGLQNDGRLWPVPLFANQPAVPKLLDKAVAHAKLAQQTPLIINQAAAGHYIVHYEDAADRTAIIDLVRQQTLGATDRLMLLNSASMLSKAGVQPFQDALTLLAAYEREHAEPVWGMIALILSEARRFIDLDESLEPRIKAFIRKLVASEVKRLGWQETTDESAADTKLRATVLSLAAYAEDPTVIKQALRLFEDYQAGKTVPAELRSLIFSVAVKEKVGDAFDWLLTLHDETPNSDLQADACAGLTATKDPAAAAVLLERVTDTKLIKPQDADFWIVSLLRNRHTRQVAWGWLVEHWDWIVKMYAPGKMYDHFPRYAAGVCNTKEWAAKYEAFFEPKRGDINLARNIAMGLNEIATRVAWLERDLPGVQTFFA